MSMKKDHMIAAALISSLLLVTTIAFFDYRGQRDSEGEANADCVRFPLASVAGPSGWVISGHMTGCSPPAASVAGYVYIHPKEAKESLDYMVFRYFDSSKGDAIAYRWIDEKTVAISLRTAAGITRLRRSVGPIRIVYSIGSEND